MNLMKRCRLWGLLFCSLAFAPHLAAQADAFDSLPEDVRELPRIGSYADPPGLGDALDRVINPINSVVETTLFFDLAFGTLTGVETDAAGEVVYERDPVMRDAEAGFRALRVDDAGQPLIRDGEPTVVEVAAGGTYQPVGDDGVPLTKQGEAKATGVKLPFLVIWLGAGRDLLHLLSRLDQRPRVRPRHRDRPRQVVGPRRRGRHPAVPRPDLGPVRDGRAGQHRRRRHRHGHRRAGRAVLDDVPGPLRHDQQVPRIHPFAQMFRTQNEDGTISGGPMFFLDLRPRGEGAPAMARRWAKSSRLCLPSS